MANLDKTWQECSLDEALQKLLKEFNFSKTVVDIAMKWKKSLKTFLWQTIGRYLLKKTM